MVDKLIPNALEEEEVPQVNVEPYTDRTRSPEDRMYWQAKARNMVVKNGYQVFKPCLTCIHSTCVKYMREGKVVGESWLCNYTALQCARYGSCNKHICGKIGGRIMEVDMDDPILSGDAGGIEGGFVGTVPMKDLVN